MRYLSGHLVNYTIYLYGQCKLSYLYNHIMVIIIDFDHSLRLRDEGKTNNFLVCVTFMKTLMNIIDDIDNVTRELRS